MKFVAPNTSTLQFFSILVDLVNQAMWVSEFFCTIGWIAIAFSEVS